MRFVALLQDNNRNDKNDKSKSDPPGIAFCFMAMPDGTRHAAMSEFDIYRFGRDFIFVRNAFSAAALQYLQSSSMNTDE